MSSHTHCREYTAHMVHMHTSNMEVICLVILTVESTLLIWYTYLQYGGYMSSHTHCREYTAHMVHVPPMWRLYV